MTGTLLAAPYVVIGGCLLAGGTIVAAVLASVVAELRRVPATGWERGPWYPPTPPAADAWTLPLGKTPAQIEDEIRELAVVIPDRPAAYWPASHTATIPNRKD